MIDLFELNACGGITKGLSNIAHANATQIGLNVERTDKLEERVNQAVKERTVLFLRQLALQKSIAQTNKFAKDLEKTMLKKTGENAEDIKNLEEDMKDVQTDIDEINTTCPLS